MPGSKLNRKILKGCQGKEGLIFLVLLAFLSCRSQQRIKEKPVNLPANQETFWQAIGQLCGHSFAGTVVAAPANDTLFKGKSLVMSVMSCNNDRIRIPFAVGDDLSRTWVLTKHMGGLQLKHDHRHKDGLPDDITMYGGSTTNIGSETLQFFPADFETTRMIPAAGGNVWWIELVPGSHFTYNLRRLGTDRFFSVRFDLTRIVADSEAPWGWKD